MRVLFTALLFLTAGVSQAAPVTIDFEDNPAVGTFGEVTTMGFFLQGAALSPSGPEWGTIITGENGTLVYGASVGPEICPSVCNQGATFEIRRDDGGYFAFYSIDIDLAIGGSPIFTGRTTGGDFVTSTVPLGTGDWLYVDRVIISWSGSGGNSSFSQALNVDNIVVAAVPIPAAAWLFLSGLGLLGFAKRKP